MEVRGIVVKQDTTGYLNATSMIKKEDLKYELQVTHQNGRVSSLEGEVDGRVVIDRDSFYEIGYHETHDYDTILHLLSVTGRLEFD